MSSAAVFRARLLAASGRPQARLRLAEELARVGASVAAVHQVAAAAHAGLPAAQTMLGLCYLHGRGVPANQPEARYWLERAAEAGDTAAQTRVAELALQGISGPYQRSAFPSSEPEVGIQPDHQRAAELARRAADGGSAEAKALLAFILCLAPAIARRPGEADALFRESAHAGAALGQLGHAIALLRSGGQESACEARALLTSAADAGLHTAHFLLGTMLEAGLGGPPDLEEAARRYRIAAENGHTGAKTRLGLALLFGRGTRRSLVEAETWLRRAALQDDALAAAVLGDFHASRDRQPPDLREAAHWYRQAAELGDPGSAHSLAQVISAGAEGKADPAEVVAWLETAIERGDGSAWPDLGTLIASSAVPPEQLPVLHAWLQRMIHEDHPQAGFYVGICVNCGIGTPADARLARRYYLWAAGEGVMDAMAAAAEMLLNGRGGRADPALARALLQYAGKHDHAGALYALGVLAGNDRDSADVYFYRAAALGHPRAKLMLRAEHAAA